MKTDILTARILSAQSATKGNRIDLSLALNPEDKGFIESVREGREKIKTFFAPGSQVIKVLELDDFTCECRLSGNGESVDCSVSLVPLRGTIGDQEYFNNFVITDRVSAIIAERYIGELIESLLEHPIIAGNNIKINKSSVLSTNTIFSTDRYSKKNQIEF